MQKKITALSIAVIFSFFLSADEGMWMLHLLKQQKLSNMQSLGLKLEDYDIYNPDGSSIKDAVVQFGGGCTGEVISSQGLVLTNHHCGYSQIQRHSSLENNYLDNGFWATSNAEELPNPGLTVTFIDKIEDVTDFVKERLKRDSHMDSLGVFFLSPSYLNGIAREKMGADYFKSNKGVDVEIKPFFDGNRYYMFTKKIYSDIRLVGAPPSSIGKFGADTDNWMWPRHTGDFSIFRIYADKDGNPSTYSEDNVPLKPKRWLKISSDGVKENDFAMILGFPGTTNKYFTSWEVKERRDIDNSIRIAMREIRQNVMLNEMLSNPAIKIMYSSKYAGSTNAYKSAIGSNWAIDNRDFYSVKEEQQNKLIKWANEYNKVKYLNALSEIERIVKERAHLLFLDRMLNEGILRSVEFARVPLSGWYQFQNVINGDEQEDIDKAINQLKEDYLMFANSNYDREVDKKVAIAMLKAYTSSVDASEQPPFFEILRSKFNGNVEDFVSYIFDESLFGNPDNYNAFSTDPESFLAVSENVLSLNNDPMFLFATSVLDESRKLSSQLQEYTATFSKARRDYMEGVLEMDGELAHFPDANLTLRLSYGKVQGYNPRDGVNYSHQTTMDGIMEKEDSTNWEFVVPDKLKELYKNSDFNSYSLSNGKMPVNFTATTHTTGGNSGSPVMNGKGELIGINFDRNWEGVGGDIQYLPNFQRSIIVDIRYVLFIIEKYAGANNIIRELELN